MLKVFLYKSYNNLSFVNPIVIVAKDTIVINPIVKDTNLISKEKPSKV